MLAIGYDRKHFQPEHTLAELRRQALGDHVADEPRPPGPSFCILMIYQLIPRWYLRRAPNADELTQPNATCLQSTIQLCSLSSCPVYAWTMSPRTVLGISMPPTTEKLHLRRPPSRGSWVPSLRTTRELSFTTDSTWPTVDVRCVGNAVTALKRAAI